MLNASYITVRNKKQNLSAFLAAELESMALLRCVTELHSIDQRYNHTFCGILTKPFTSITGTIQGHLLIFSLHEELQSY